MQANHMQFYKTGHWVVFITLGQKHASKDGIELAVFAVFGEVLSFGLGVAELVLVLLLIVRLVTGSPSFTPWSTAYTNKHTIKTPKTKICRRARNGDT